MENLIAEGSRDKPTINFDKEKGNLYLGGSSLPENVLEVYTPILNWLDEYIKQPNAKTKIEFHFEYLNTASSRMIMRVLEKCIELNSHCEKLDINWCYTTGDLDMRDFGLELIELTNFPINLITRDYQP